jgi:hypothetical protein
MFKNKISWLTLIFSLLIFSVNGYAQGSTYGRISGVVTDPNGAVIAGATVKITNLDTNAEREVATGDDGNFAFQLLPPARYRVEISANGFQTVSVEAVVNITQTTALDVPLKVAGSMDSSVLITGETPVLQSETSQTGRVIEGETIRQLPLPTRNFQQLLTLQSGAQSSVSNNTDLGRGDNNISVNGQRSTSNSIRINGVDANSIGTNSTPNLAVPSPDSLQEFIIQTSLYDASNGRNAGGNVEAVTRGGSNDFRGNAFIFLRNKNLNANEPFVKARGLDRPILSRYQYGGTLGGRIISDRAFFFGSYQGTNERNALSLNNSLTFPSIPAGLTDANRTAAGLGAAFGINPAFISPVALNILNARLDSGQFAIPSSGRIGSSATTAVATVQTGLSRFRENQFNANFDVIVSENHSLASKLFFADNPTTQANYNFAGLGNRLEGQPPTQLVGFGGDFVNRQTLYSLTDNYVFSSGIANQARFGFYRLRVTSVPQEPFTAAQLGISNPLGSLYAGAPTIQVAGADSNFFFGSSPLSDQSSRINAYTFQDTVSIVAGKHRVRVGGEFRYSTVKFFFNAFSRGQLIFTSFSNFLQGNGVSIIGSGVYDRSYRVKDFNTFVQDDFRVNDRLTLNLGLRYDLFGLPVDTDGRLVNFLPGCTYLHDLALVGGDLHGNAVGENAVVRLGQGGPPERVWWPRCVERDGTPDVSRNYLQLNSIAAGPDVESSYFSASSERISTRRPGHRNYPVDRRGVIFSGSTREPMARGLTRPHSARLRDGRVWVANSGYGELGVAADGGFEPVVRFPGWTRGLSFAADVAFVGTSRVLPHFRQYAPGLEVDRSECAVHAVRPATGEVLGSLVWPYGNQIFAVEPVPSSFSLGFPFLAAGRSSQARAKRLFYSFQAHPQEIGQ